MSQEPARSPARIAPGLIALFAVCTFLTGAVGSVEIARAKLCGYPVPFERLVPVTVTGELFAYFAVMLLQLGGTVPVPQVCLAAVVGMALRAAQAAGAALLGPPEDTESFGAAFAHFYAENYVAAGLQILVTILFLWLIRGVFERPATTVLLPSSDVPDMEPERLRGFHQGLAERRRELIDELMNTGSASEAAQPTAPPEAPHPAPPTQEPAAEPITLTPRQSVVLALREEDAVEAAAPDAVVAEGRLQPSVAQVTFIAQAVTDAVAPLGGAKAVVRTSGAHRTIVVAVPELPDPERPLPACEHVTTAAAALADSCGLGQTRRVLMRHAEGHVGVAAVVREGTGFLAVIATPVGANLGAVAAAMSRLESVPEAGALPFWPPMAQFALPAAHADEDLAGRFGPLLEWVPEASGLVSLAATVLGRQVVMLAREMPAPACAAAAVGGFDAACELCTVLQRPPADLVLWDASAGALACAPAQVAGQHILLCLSATGPAAAVQANLQLGQVMKGLARLTVT